MAGFTNIPNLSWQSPVTSASVLPPGAQDGEARVTLDDNSIYIWDAATATWNQVSGGGGGSAAWGDITGTLSNQTDLQNALNLKANLTSPTFITSATIQKTTSGSADLNFTAPDRPATGQVSLDWESGAVTVYSQGDEVMLKRSGNLVALSTLSDGISIGPTGFARIKTGDGSTVFNFSPNLVRVTGDLGTITDNGYDWGYDGAGNPEMRPRKLAVGTSILLGTTLLTGTGGKLSAPALNIPVTDDFPAVNRVALQRTVYTLVDQDITYKMFHSDGTIEYLAGTPGSGNPVTIASVAGHAIVVQLGDPSFPKDTAVQIVAALDAYELANPGTISVLTVYSVTGVGVDSQSPHGAETGTAAQEDLFTLSGFSDGVPGNDEVILTYTDPYETATQILAGYAGTLDIAPPPNFDSSAGVINLNGPTNVASSLRASSTLSVAVLLSDYQFEVPTAGSTVTIAADKSVVVLDPAGTLATLTITLPAAVDGQRVRLGCSQIVTSLTLNATGGDSVKNALTTLAAGGTAEYIYRLANTTWYKIG